MVEFSLWDILRNLLLAARWTVSLSLIAFIGGGLVGLVLLVLRLSKLRGVDRAVGAYVQVFQVRLALMRNTLIDMSDAEYEALFREARVILDHPPPIQSSPPGKKVPWRRTGAIFDRYIDQEPSPYFAAFKPQRVTLSANSINVDQAILVDNGGGFMIHHRDGRWTVVGGYGENCSGEQYWPRPDPPLRKTWTQRCPPSPTE